jgi:hypothetical protein
MRPEEIVPMFVRLREESTIVVPPNAIVAALKAIAKRLDEVLLVVEALVAKKLVVVLLVDFRLVTVPDAEVRSVIVPAVIVVVASVAVPVAVNVPVTRLVVVALVAVKLAKNAVTPFMRLEKKLVEVAFVLNKFTLVAFVVFRLEIVPEAEVRSFTVPLVIVVVAKTDVPVAVRVPVVRLDDEALPSVEVPAVNVVMLALVAVRLVKNAVIPFMRLVKKLVVVAFVATRLVVVLFVDELFVL